MRCARHYSVLMTDLRDVFREDLQASQPEVRLGLSRAGVTGVSKAIRIRYGETEKLIAAEIVERQGAGRAEARITARYPVERRTPVTGLATQAMLGLIGIAAASAERVRRVVGVEATGINACPCAQGLVRERAVDRLLEAGVRGGDVERILELVPLATHNQRGGRTSCSSSSTRTCSRGSSKTRCGCHSGASWTPTRR